jgi:hypothetical protein
VGGWAKVREQWFSLHTFAELACRRRGLIDDLVKVLKGCNAGYSLGRPWVFSHTEGRENRRLSSWSLLNVMEAHL